MSLINLTNKRFVNIFGNPFINYCLAKSTNVDAIDSFTTELVEKKTLKWNILRKLKPIRETPDKPSVQYSARKIIKEIHNLRHSLLMVDLMSLSQAQIDNLVTSSMQSYDSGNQEDLHNILGQCSKFERLPTDFVCLATLKFLGTNGKAEQLNDFIALLKKVNTHFYTFNMELKHYEALCFWKNGNVDKSLNLLKAAYEHPSRDSSENEHNEFHQIIEEIIGDTIGHKSEGVLIALTNFGTHFADNFQDFFILTNIWTHCFVSEWFSDQQVAVKLFRGCEEFRRLIGEKTSRISFMLLRKHDVDGVHRLIELLIKYDMKPECKNCMSLLFDYQYWRKDLRACSEIMQSGLTLGLPLSSVQNQQLLNLLIGKSSRIITKPVVKPPTFKLRF